MAKNLLKKIGYYSLYEISDKVGKKYMIDNGSTLFIARLNKTIKNPYRDTQIFSTEKQAINYISVKLSKNRREKQKKLDSLPKSLYLVLLKEESTGKIFVKVGFTSKKFIYRRFSKIYGYDGYTLQSILRKVETPKAESLEKKIKEALNKKRSIKKYRPILESFSGYSECYDNLCLDEIIQIFDKIVKV